MVESAETRRSAPCLSWGDGSMDDLRALLAGIDSNHGATWHVTEWARRHGAAMVVSGYFCGQSGYWADIITPGRASIGYGATPDEATLDAAYRYAATHLPSERDDG